MSEQLGTCIGYDRPHPRKMICKDWKPIAAASELGADNCPRAKEPYKPPVATQLERLEQGLDVCRGHDVEIVGKLMAIEQQVEQGLGDLKQDVSEVAQSLAESYKGPEIFDTLLKVHDGLDKLMQSHAALAQELGAVHETIINRNAGINAKLDGIRDGLVDVIGLLPSKVFREFQARITPEYAKPVKPKRKRKKKR